MTNQELINLLEEEQKRITSKNYPNWKYKVRQTKKEIIITWEYLDVKYVVDKRNLIVRNPYNEIINNSFDFNNTLEDTLKSLVHYLVTRY